jgi:RNA polymerase sigma-70 factor (ECF subfamily)
MSSKVMSKDISKSNDNIALDSHVHRRDRKAITELHAQYFSKIKHHIASSIGSNTDAEDLAQDVFVEFYKGNGRFRENGNPEKYHFGIARNVVRGYYRQRERSVDTISIEEIGTPTTICEAQQQSDPVNFTEIQELIKIIEEKIAKLPPKSRQALKLYFIDNLSTKQAAQKSGCSMNTFHQRLYLGIKALIKSENRLLEAEIRKLTNNI